MKKSNNIISDWLDKFGDPEIDKKVEMELEKINKERYNHIIDEVYGKYADSHEYIVDGWLHIVPMVHNKETFVEECKTDSEFSEKWGLKIEERELSLEEQRKLAKYDSEFVSPMTVESWDRNNIPTKQITLEYNGTKIEVYE